MNDVSVLNWHSPMWFSALWRSRYLLPAVLAAALSGGSGYAETLSTDPLIAMARCGANPVGELTVATLHNAPIVTLLANGHPVVLLLDTGAERTVLTPPVAERIGAQAPRIGFQRQMRGIAGTLSTREVELHSFVAGGIPITWRRVAVAPITMPRVFSTPLDGVLGTDVLSGFALDLDLPRYRMRLFPKGSCPNGPPWSGPYSAITTGLSPDGHLFFPIQLDGRRVVAFIDTGAQQSVLSETVARALGVTESVLARDRPITIQGATTEQLRAFLHKFSVLKIGTEVIRNPEFAVGSVNLRDADLVLGIDFLLSRRLWLSYGLSQVFISKQ